MEPQQFKQRNVANEKLDKFKVKIDSDKDMFGKPTELPMAKDATSFSPTRGTAYGRTMVESDDESGVAGRITEQFGAGLGKVIDGAFNAIK